MAKRAVTLFVIFSTLFPFVTDAATLPFSVRQAVVRVVCGDRQGSGVVVNGAKGYVLTNAHILVNFDTDKPEPCTVTFLATNTDTDPTVEYYATGVAYAYEESVNRDFALLQIGTPVGFSQLTSFPFLKTDEFSTEGTPISVASYPGYANGNFTVTTGTVLGLSDGIIGTDAVIAPGASGGAGITDANNFVGLSTRILSIETSPGIEEIVEYQLVDIRAIESWMDALSDRGHDAVITHADEVRAHVATGYITQARLQCTMLVRTPQDSAVSCLKKDGTRTIFPSAATFLTWFGDFSGVVTVSPTDLTPYQLVSSVTMKPGTLIKITTDPHVYLVTDSFGTIRWIENETIAEELYGEGWAGFVKDVSDGFFTNYRVGASIR